MKKLISITSIISFMLVSAVVFGQVDIKSTSTDSKDKTTEKKTSDTKTEQKVDMGSGGYTKSGKKIDAPATMGEKEKQAEPSGIGTKDLPPATGSIIYDRMGEVLYTVAADGKIKDAKGVVIGQYTKDGNYLGPDGEKLGNIKNGVITVKDGKVIGKLEADGTVTNGKGKLLGTIADDGTVRNSHGSRLGSAPRVDRNIAAMLFFNKKKQSGERKQSTSTDPGFDVKPIEKK